MKNKRAIKNTILSDFYCISCNNRISLPRKKSHMRNAGHTKHIYCYICMERKVHIEVRDGHAYAYAMAKNKNIGKNKTSKISVTHTN